MSSRLQTVWCRKFPKTSKPSVSALYGAGRRPVSRLETTRGKYHLALVSKHQTWGLHSVPHCKQFGAGSFQKHQNLLCLLSAEPADARFRDYKGQVALSLNFKAPNLGPAFSSRLQTVWCREFSKTSKPSVSAPYGAGPRPVLRLEGKSSI